MIKGFTILEVLISLTLTLTIFSIVLTNVNHSVKSSKRINDHQNTLEAVFFTVDRLKEDLIRCGMRLQDISLSLPLDLLVHTRKSLKIKYGKAVTRLKYGVEKNQRELRVENLLGFSKNKQVLIFNHSLEKFEFFKISAIRDSAIHLNQGLKNDYDNNSTMILIKTIEYKFYNKQKVLKRKIDNGYFQPLIEQVTDFFISYYPDTCSILYRLEINKKEQVQGYIFLNNMVGK
jgi:type II secretory pathway pseudopilin PulG